MSAKSKKSAAKKKNEKLKKKQAAKIARKAVIEKKAAADPSLKIKEDKKELAAQRKAEKREKKLQKKRELAKKKKLDLKADKKPPKKQTKPDSKKAAIGPKKDKPGKEKKEAQPAPAVKETPKHKRHEKKNRPVSSEPAALPEAGSLVLPVAVPEPGVTRAAPARELSREENSTAPAQKAAFERLPLPDEEETTVGEQPFEEGESVPPRIADDIEHLPPLETQEQVGEEPAQAAAHGEEIIEPRQPDILEPLPPLETQEQTQEEPDEASEQGEEIIEPRQPDILEPLPPLEDVDTDFYNPVQDEEVLPPRKSDILEPLPPLHEPVAPVQPNNGKPQGAAPAPGSKSWGVPRRDDSRQWLTVAAEPEGSGPLDEVLPNSVLKLPQLPPSEPQEIEITAQGSTDKSTVPQRGEDLAAVPFDTGKYIGPQTPAPKPPVQTAPRQGREHGPQIQAALAQIGKHIAFLPITLLSQSYRLYHFAAYQLAKLRRIPRTARIVLLAVCLLCVAAAAGGLLYQHLHYEIPDAAKPVYGGVNIREDELRDIDIPIEQQLEEVAATKAKGDKDIFKFYARTDIVISEPADILPIVLGNLKQNDKTFIVSLVDREGALIARTLGLPPGKYLPSITLIDQRMPYGEYDLKLVVSAYDSDTMAYLGSQYADFRLVIGIEQEGRTATPGQ